MVLSQRILMTRRLALLGLMISCLVVSRAWADDTNAPPADADGSVALASRFESLARQTLRASNLSSSAWLQSSLLLKAAVQLDPNEPSYGRLLADDLLSINDGPGAIAALKAYTLLDPDDQTAQVQLIDLYLAKMQSADEKIKYLHAIVAKEPITPEVRSAAAERCARLLLARSEPADALTMLNTALELNHLNIEAMRLKYDMTAAAASPMDRVMQLFSMLQASPSDPTLSTRLARQLADAGLIDESLQWFGYANQIYNAAGLRPDPLFACGIASELIVASRITDADKILSPFAADQPDNVQGWLLYATASKYQAESNPDDQVIQAANNDLLRQAEIGLGNRVLELRAQAGATDATTRPMDSPTVPALPDLSGDPDLLVKANNTELTDDYIYTVTSLAWFELYYRHDAAAADPLLSILGKMLSNRDVQLARLRGWRQFIGGDPVAATTKLVAVQAADPLAALGLILIDLNDPKKQQDAINRGKQLLQDNPSGLTAATILASLHKYDVSLEASPRSEAVATAVDNWPRDIFQIISQPRSMYVINAEPVKDDYLVGEPILIRVTIENVGNTDLSIGPDGALHPDLWFDAYLRGLDMRSFAGAAFDRIDQRLVLPVGQTVTKIVRVDDGALYGIFNENPGISLTVNFGIVTNPMAVQASGGMGTSLGRPGPGGYGAQLNRMVLRDPVPFGSDSAREDMLNALLVGDGGTKIRMLDILSSYLAEMPSGASPDTLAIGQKFASHIHQACDDKTPAVAAWAKFVLANISAADDRATILAQMETDPNWQSRFTALVFRSLAKDQTAIPVHDLTKDKNPLVRSFAAALASRVSATADSTPANPPTTP
jgi:tetratricopeptide (TPR) repeat protein